jgi:molybdenum cofactor biosynthesis enzyme MoaA
MVAGMRADLKKYVVISIWFGCNNACSICMLSDLKEKMPAVGFGRYQEVLAAIVSQGHLENLILSGAEVTTFAELGEYVRFAQSLGWFKKIQIQTNGRQLSDIRYLEHLIACGVNEFFVSIHGLEETHDATARHPGAFAQTMKGLANLAAFADVNVITNTVLTKTNFHEIPDLIRALPEKVSEIQLWNYFPMASADTRDLIVSLKDFAKILPQIISLVSARGQSLTLKGFPECLPVENQVMDGLLNNFFPITVLPDMFWEKFSSSGFGQCFHRPNCTASACWGMSRAYIEKYGDERELLKPVRHTHEGWHN